MNNNHRKKMLVTQIQGYLKTTELHITQEKNYFNPMTQF